MIRGHRPQSRTRVVGLCIAVFLAGCVGCSSKPKKLEIFNGAPLPKPARVLVYDFEIAPEDVDPAHGVSARTRAAAKGKPRTEAEIASGKKLAAALSVELVGTIEELGITAVRAAYPVLPTGNDLALRGQFLTLHEGNPPHQVEIGLAGARAQVHAEVQIYQGSLRVEEFEDVATESSRAAAPGGPVAGFEQAVARDSAPPVPTPDTDDSKPFGADPEADAARTAAKLAKPLAAFFLRQGWISGATQ